METALVKVFGVYKRCYGTRRLRVELRRKGYRIGQQRLKTEVLEGRERPVFTDLADAQASIADYFDYYNHERLHSSIDYQTP